MEWKYIFIPTAATYGNKVYLYSNGGELFKVELTVTKVSGKIRHLLNERQCITLNISSDTLRKVLQFLKRPLIRGN
jgi:hypothetical protein